MVLNDYWGGEMSKHATAVAWFLLPVIIGCYAQTVEDPLTHNRDEDPSNAIMNWIDLTSQPQPVPDETIRYGQHPLQVVDVWQPKSDAPVPAVIMIHGGCWQTAVAERDLMNWICDDLRKHGIGVWNIEYRGVDRDGGYPNTYLDVGTAADLFRQRGAEFGFRTDRVIVMGHSAGGHLTLWLANRTSLPANESIRGSNPINVAVAISQGGLPNLRAAAARDGHPCGTSAPKQMSGSDLKMTSPPEMTPADSTQVLFHNSLDLIAPPEYARDYVAVMKGKQRKVTLIETPGEGHVELVAPTSESWKRQRAFLLKQFGLPDVD